MKPFADLYRPTELKDVVGQDHLLGESGLLSKIIASKKIPNMIFYGPSGTGKTTVARIIARLINKRFYSLNATNAGTKDIKEILSSLNELENINGVLLYLDEIQYFSKKQQQSLLECIEDGSVTLIASTTENPYFYVYNAILSRSIIFEFKKVPVKEIERHLKNVIKLYEENEHVKLNIEDGVLNILATASGGDVRKSMNFLDALLLSSDLIGNTYELKKENALIVCSLQGHHFDRDGDEHYDTLSAFQKSIRGSDPDAAIFYLARLLKAGDIISPIRRLLVIACEDIGLAHPQAIAIVKACCDSALQLGLPEARIPLSEATIFLATAPKSNSAILAIDEALNDVGNGKGGKTPLHLQDAHYEGSKKLGHGLTYIYPHDYPFHYVKQQYLPDDLKNKKYYVYQDNKIENAAKLYWDQIKGKKDE